MFSIGSKGPVTTNKSVPLEEAIADSPLVKLFVNSFAAAPDQIAAPLSVNSVANASPLDSFVRDCRVLLTKYKIEPLGQKVEDDLNSLVSDSGIESVALAGRLNLNEADIDLLSSYRAATSYLRERKLFHSEYKIRSIFVCLVAQNPHSSSTALREAIEIELDHLSLFSSEAIYPGEKEQNDYKYAVSLYITLICRIFKIRIDGLDLADSYLYIVERLKQYLQKVPSAVDASTLLLCRKTLVSLVTRDEWFQCKNFSLAKIILKQISLTDPALAKWAELQLLLLEYRQYQVDNETPTASYTTLLAKLSKLQLIEGLSPSDVVLLVQTKIAVMIKVATLKDTPSLLENINIQFNTSISIATSATEELTFFAIALLARSRFEWAYYSLFLSSKEREGIIIKALDALNYVENQFGASQSLKRGARELIELFSTLPDQVNLKAFKREQVLLIEQFKLLLMGRLHEFMSMTEENYFRLERRVVPFTITAKDSYENLLDRCKQNFFRNIAFQVAESGEPFEKLFALLLNKSQKKYIQKFSMASKGLMNSQPCNVDEDGANISFEVAASVQKVTQFFHEAKNTTFIEYGLIEYLIFFNNFITLKMFPGFLGPKGMVKIDDCKACEISNFTLLTMISDTLMKVAKSFQGHLAMTSIVKSVLQKWFTMGSSSSTMRDFFIKRINKFKREEQPLLRKLRRHAISIQDAAKLLQYTYICSDYVYGDTSLEVNAVLYDVANAASHISIGTLEDDEDRLVWIKSLANLIRKRIETCKAKNWLDKIHELELDLLHIRCVELCLIHNVDERVRKTDQLMQEVPNTLEGILKHFSLTPESSPFPVLTSICSMKVRHLADKGLHKEATELYVSLACKFHHMSSTSAQEEVNKYFHSMEKVPTLSLGSTKKFEFDFDNLSREVFLPE